MIYEFPNDVRITFNSKQEGKFWEDIACRVYGWEGVIDTHYGGVVKVMCDDAFNGGVLDNLYTDGAVNNISSFPQSDHVGGLHEPHCPAKRSEQSHNNPRPHRRLQAHGTDLE